MDEKKKSTKKKLADSLIRLLYYRNGDNSRYKIDKRFIEENVEAVSKEFDRASKKPDDLDKILRQCINKVKTEVYFKRLHPESKSGRKTHLEALDEKYIAAHLTQLEDALQEEPNISVAFQKVKESERNQKAASLDD